MNQEHMGKPVDLENARHPDPVRDSGLIDFEIGSGANASQNPPDADRVNDVGLRFGQAKILLVDPHCGVEMFHHRRMRRGWKEPGTWSHLDDPGRPAINRFLSYQLEVKRFRNVGDELAAFIVLADACGAFRRRLILPFFPRSLIFAILSALLLGRERMTILPNQAFIGSAIEGRNFADFDFFRLVRCGRIGLSPGPLALFAPVASVIYDCFADNLFRLKLAPNG